MRGYKKKIDNMKWSFSRLNSWKDCKLSWKMHYVDDMRGEENIWSQAGSLGHNLFEKYGNGEIEPSDMAELWLSAYDDYVTCEPPEFPIDLKQHYKFKVLEFFNTFSGFNSETLDVELEFTYELPNGKMIGGFIDRVSEGIIVTDYKISKKFKKKDLEAKSRQILLYAPAIKQKYGEMPKSGYFYFFQTGEYIEVKITEEDVEKALKWATDTIEEIRNAKEFPAKIDSMTEKEAEKDMMCKSLCSFRNVCQAKLEILGATN